MTGRENLIKLESEVVKCYDKLLFINRNYNEEIETNTEWMKDGLVYEANQALKNPEIYGDARIVLERFLNDFNCFNIFDKVKYFIENIKKYTGTMYII